MNYGYGDYMTDRFILQTAMRESDESSNQKAVLYKRLEEVQWDLITNEV